MVVVIDWYSDLWIVIEADWSCLMNAPTDVYQ